MLIYLFVPETLGATTWENDKRTINYIALDALNQIFEVSTVDRVRYHLYITNSYITNFFYWLTRRRDRDGHIKRVRVDPNMHYEMKVRRPRAEKLRAAQDATSSDSTLSQPNEDEQTAAGAADDRGTTADTSSRFGNAVSRSQSRDNQQSRQGSAQEGTRQADDQDAIQEVPRIGRAY